MASRKDTDVRIITFLCWNSIPVSVTELAEKTDVSVQSAIPVVQQLEQPSIILADKTPGREKLVRLHPDIRNFFLECLKILRAASKPAKNGGDTIGHVMINANPCAIADL
ncbi:MAG: hypothetical protein ABSF90_08455 [Syntrophobacteraceae bacterium]|jgi:DNA-binding transcriptional regulator GbsR (MarR family)